MRVFMVINTSGLEYDDRLRKESLSLLQLGHQVEILALEYANLKGQRRVYGGIQATTIRLVSRSFSSSGKGLWLKLLEAHIRLLFLSFRRKADVIWIHNAEMAGLVPFFAILRIMGLVQRLIWDHHELPPRAVLARPALRSVFSWLCNRCDVLISANMERKAFLQEHLGELLDVPIYVLANLPDRLFLDSPRVELDEGVRSWLNGEGYILAQGGAAPGRYFQELVAAVLGMDGIKLIVIGPYTEAQIREASDRGGESFDKRVLMTGFIPQMWVIPYIDHAQASIVLYNSCSENSRLCAPNRLYQAACRGTPVIVGSNPPMAAFVREWQCGIILSGDGRDVEDIRTGIKMVLAQGQTLCTHSVVYGPSLVWDSQSDIVAEIVGTIAQQDR